MIQKGSVGAESVLNPASGSDSDEAQQGKQSGVDSDSSLGPGQDPTKDPLQNQQPTIISMEEKELEASLESRTQANSVVVDSKMEGLKVKQA